MPSRRSASSSTPTPGRSSAKRCASALDASDPLPYAARARAEDEGAAIDVSAILVRARAGDRDAFAAFHARFARFVHAVLLAHAPPAEVDDLHQKVFVSA